MRLRKKLKFQNFTNFQYFENFKTSQFYTSPICQGFQLHEQILSILCFSRNNEMFFLKDFLLNVENENVLFKKCHPLETSFYTFYICICNTLGNKINATPVHSAKIGKFQDTITSSKIIV